MPGYQGYGYYPDPEEERRLREMDLTQDPEALAGSAGVRPPPTMDLTQDPVALQGSPDWQRMNQSRVDMRDELDNPPPSMDLTRDPAALNSPMLQRQMAQRAPQPPAAGLPMQGSLSSLLPQRDSQMDSRWRTAENNALDSSGYMGDQKYGVGEAVRDFAPMAVGGALDVLINHGRGLKSGAIIGAGMQANAQQQQNRDEEAKAAGSFALNARNQRASNSRANVASQTEARQQQMYDLQNNPDNPQAQTFREQIYARSPSMQGKLDGLTYNQMRQMAGANQMVMKSDFTPQLAQDQGVISAERQRGTNRAQDEHFPTRLNQEAGVAAATADARNQVDTSYAPQRTNEKVTAAYALIPPTVQGKVAAEEAGVGVGQGLSGHMDVNDLMKSNPGLNFTNPKLVQDALRTRSLTKDVISKIDGANRGATVIDRLHDAAEQFQEAAAHGDIKGAWNARRLYNSHAEEYAGALEAVTGNKSDAAKAGFLKLVPSLADPTAPEGVKTLWSSIEANVDSNLGTYGIKPNKPRILGGKDYSSTADAVAQPPAAPQSSMQGGREVLPPGNAPPIPVKQYPNAQTREIPTPPSNRKAVQRPDGMFDVPNGKRPYSAQEVEVFRRAGLLQ